VKDLAGRDLTAAERRLLEAYGLVTALLREPGLAPSTDANLREAAAALFVAANELALPVPRPDDLLL
jgi:hypothetical protein